MLYILKSALESEMARDMAKRGVSFKVAEELSEVPNEKGCAALFEKRDNYAHPCPGTKAPYLCCGYLTSDVMEGCPFDCAYCILQAYLPHKNLWVSANTLGIKEDILKLSREAEGKRVRLGTGELSDSLAMDDIFHFTRLLVPLINAQERVIFEFKTKSDRIGNLLNLNPKNVIVSWSLNPQEIVCEFERGAAPTEKRLRAAHLIAEAGYKVAFHFDPVIYREDLGVYAKLIEELTTAVAESSVAYISLGALRGPPPLFTAMRERVDLGRLLAADFIRSSDGKMRYFKALRIELLKFVVKELRRYWKKAFIYLCMESPTVWKEVLGAFPNSREEFEAMYN